MIFLFLLCFLQFCLVLLVLCGKTKDGDRPKRAPPPPLEQPVIDDDAFQIWTIKMEFDSRNPLPEKWVVLHDFHKIQRIYGNHQCKKGSCGVCPAYMEWAVDLYKKSYKYEMQFPAEIRGKLEEFFANSQRIPLCCENPHWAAAMKDIKKNNKKPSKDGTSGQSAERARKSTGSLNDMTNKEQAAAIQQSILDYTQWFNQNGKNGKSPAEVYRNLSPELLPGYKEKPAAQVKGAMATKTNLGSKETAAQPVTPTVAPGDEKKGLAPPLVSPEEKKYTKKELELLQAKKTYGIRVTDDYYRLYDMYNLHNCANTQKKKVSEPDSCLVCSNFIEWAAEQYEESYRDFRYPYPIRREIEKVFYAYKGKLPLCISNPDWPKAKNRIQGSKPKKMSSNLDEEGSDALGVLEAVSSGSADLIEKSEDKYEEVTGTTPSRYASRETTSAIGSTTGVTPSMQVDQNPSVEITQESDGKRRMKTAQSGSDMRHRKHGSTESTGSKGRAKNSKARRSAESVEGPRKSAEDHRQSAINLIMPKTPDKMKKTKNSTGR